MIAQVHTVCRRPQVSTALCEQNPTADMLHPESILKRARQGCTARCPRPQKQETGKDPPVCLSADLQAFAPFAALATLHLGLFRLYGRSHSTPAPLPSFLSFGALLCVRLSSHVPL